MGKEIIFLGVETLQKSLVTSLWIFNTILVPNLVPRACDPWEGNEGSGIIRNQTYRKLYVDRTAHALAKAKQIV
jgi:hypothetical protein